MPAGVDSGSGSDSGFGAGGGDWGFFGSSSSSTSIARRCLGVNVILLDLALHQMKFEPVEVAKQEGDIRQHRRQTRPREGNTRGAASCDRASYRWDIARSGRQTEHDQ